VKGHLVVCVESHVARICVMSLMWATTPPALGKGAKGGRHGLFLRTFCVKYLLAQPPNDAVIFSDFDVHKLLHTKFQSSAIENVTECEYPRHVQSLSPLTSTSPSDYIQFPSHSIPKPVSSPASIFKYQGKFILTNRQWPYSSSHPKIPVFSTNPCFGRLFISPV
jgi:hypothetical protein